MAGILFLDGFDDYSAPNTSAHTSMLSAGWSDAGAQCQSKPFTPHGIGQAIRIPNSFGDADPFCARAYGKNVADLITGFHFNINSGSAFASAGLDIIGFCREDFLGSYGTTLTLRRNAQSGLTLTTQGGAGGVFATSDANICFPGTWYFVELRFNFLTNELIVRLDEEVILEATTSGLPINAINMMRFIGPPGSTNPELMIDNMYALDGQGAAAPFNDFLGEIIVFDGQPNGDAGPNDFTIHGTTEDEHFECVDDAYVDDSNYLSTTEINDGEYFTITDVPDDTIEVLAVGVAARMRKDAGSPARFRMKSRVGANETVFPSRTIEATFMTKYEWMTLQPDGSAWTLSAANAVEVGVETMPV